MKKNLYTALILVCALVLSGLATVYAAPMESFNMGLEGDAKNLDPHRATDTMSFTVLRHINEPLVTVDGRTKKLVPVLAERWEMLDPETYKFYLKKGVKFHNGEELTAEDVVFSLKRATQKECVHAGSRGRLIDPDGFKIVDRYTVIVKTRGPIGGWLGSMKHPFASIFSKKAVEEGGEEYFRNPVGTGPFVFKNWVKGEKIELERFENYHGKPANFKKLTFRVMPDDSSRVIALETGKVDMIYGVPPSEVERLNNSPKTKVVLAPGLRLRYLGMNTQKKPLSDPKVRLAIEYAINKEAYGQVVYQGNSDQPDGLLIPASTFAPKNAKPFPYDPKKAKALLKEAGYPDGFTMELRTGNLQDNVNGATVIQSMLSQIGITVDIKVFEPGALVSKMVNEDDYDSYIAQWGMQTSRSAGTFWLSLFFSGGIGSSNWARLNDAKVDEYIQAAQHCVDAKKHEELLQKIWDRLNTVHPIVPLVVPKELYGARKDLGGLEELADGQLNYLGNLYLKD